MLQKIVITGIAGAFAAILPLLPTIAVGFPPAVASALAAGFAAWMLHTPPPSSP